MPINFWSQTSMPSIETSTSSTWSMPFFAASPPGRILTTLIPDKQSDRRMPMPDTDSLSQNDLRSSTTCWLLSLTLVAAATASSLQASPDLVADASTADIRLGPPANKTRGILLPVPVGDLQGEEGAGAASRGAGDEISIAGPAA